MTTTTQPPPEAPAPFWALRQPGLVVVGTGDPSPWADARALALLGCRDGADLTAAWAAVVPSLHAAGLLPSPAAAVPGPVAVVELAAVTPSGRPLRVSAVHLDRAAAGSRPAGGPLALLLEDAELAAGGEGDERAAAQMQSLAQIAPAVAHDLRAPINAMVLNLEVLKETLAAAPGTAGAPPPAWPAPAAAGGRDPLERQRRYVRVLREELARLHQSVELFIAHISPRGNRLEILDLRDLARDLGAILVPPARKQQTKVETLLPDIELPVLGHRYQLRQALLHVGLAALERVPRGGTLEIRLDRPPHPPARARLRLAAAAPPHDPEAPIGTPAAGAPVPGPATATGAAPGAAAAWESRLRTARAILADGGGTLHLPGEQEAGFAIGLPLSVANDTI